MLGGVGWNVWVTKYVYFCIFSSRYSIERQEERLLKLLFLFFYDRSTHRIEFKCKKKKTSDIWEVYWYNINSFIIPHVLCISLKVTTKFCSCVSNVLAAWEIYLHHLLTYIGAKRWMNPINHINSSQSFSFYDYYTIEREKESYCKSDKVLYINIHSSPMWYSLPCVNFLLAWWLVTLAFRCTVDKELQMRCFILLFYPPIDPPAHPSHPVTSEIMNV